jgi:hypothetical protein
MYFTVFVYMSFHFDISQYFYTPNIFFAFGESTVYCNWDNSEYSKILITIVKDNTHMILCTRVALMWPYHLQRWYDFRM